MNHVGDRGFKEIHPCECSLLTIVDLVIFAINFKLDDKQFLAPCSYIEDGIVYRIGLEIKDEQIMKNYIWEVNKKNYNLFRAEIKKAYGVALPKSNDLSSRQMDDLLFEFFEELYMKENFKEVHAKRLFKLNGFTVVI